MTAAQGAFILAVQAARVCGDVAAKMVDRGREDDAVRCARDAWHCARVAMEYLGQIERLR